MADKVKVNPRYLDKSKNEVQKLLDDVEGRSFLRDMTEDEYDALSKEEQENGDLYLLHDPEE